MSFGKVYEFKGTKLKDGRYEVMNRLHGTEIAQIFSVVDLQNDEQKIMKQLINYDQPIISEIEALLELNSCPNIIKHYDLFRYDIFYFIITEDVQYGNLAELIHLKAKRKNDSIQREKIFDWSKQILTALDLLHARNIIHRDLNPRNILLNYGGDVVICDFGLISNPMSIASFFADSINYFSPEVIKGDKYDAKIDVWSFGCVIYELLTLTRAFLGDCVANPTIDMKFIQSEPEKLLILIKNSTRENSKERSSARELLDILTESKTREKTPSELLAKRFVSLSFNQKSSLKSSSNGQFQSSTSNFDRKQVEEFTKKGDDSFENDQYQLALSYFHKSLDYYFKSTKNERNLDMACLMDKMGQCYVQLFDPINASEQFQKAYETRLNIYGQQKDHPDLIDSLLNLGECCTMNVNLAKALDYYDKAHQMAVRLYAGQDNVHLAKTLNKLGHVHNRLKEPSVSLEFTIQSLDMCSRLFKNDDHPIMAETLNTFGDTYSLLDEAKTGLDYRLKSLEMRRRLLKNQSGDHWTVAESLENVAKSYDQLGDNKMALDYRLKAVEMNERIFKNINGGYHSFIADSYYDIAQSYELLDDKRNAVDYYHKCIKVRNVLYPEDHVKKADALNRIGNCYNDLKNYQSALEYKLDGFEMRKRIFKDADHEDVSESLQSIAISYEKLGNHKRALEFHLKSLQMTEKLAKSRSFTLPFAYNQIAISTFYVAACYMNMNEFKKALTYFLRAADIWEAKINDTQNEQFADVLFNTAHCYLNLNENKKAIEYGLSCVKLREKLHEKQPDKNRSDLMTSLKMLSVYYSKVKDHQNEEKYLKLAKDLE